MILFYEFLTLWSLLIHILDVRFNIVFLNTYVLSLIVSFFGLYITYYIKELNIGKIKLQGKTLFVIDFIFHQLPFIYMLLNHDFYKKRYTSQHTCLTVLFICIYYIFIDIYKVYKFNKNKTKTKHVLLFTLFSVVVLLYNSSMLNE